MKAAKQKPNKQRQTAKKGMEQEVRRTRQEENLSPHGESMAQAYEKKGASRKR